MTTTIHDSNSWCEECQGADHAPWCSLYAEKVAEAVSGAKTQPERSQEAEIGTSGGCCDRCDYSDRQEQSLLTEKEAQLVLGAIPLQALPDQPLSEEAYESLRDSVLERVSETLNGKPCCGWDVRRDYIISECRDRLICPDCGKEYSRSEHGRRERELRIERVHAAMAEDCDCPKHQTARIDPAHADRILTAWKQDRAFASLTTVRAAIADVLDVGDGSDYQWWSFYQTEAEHQTAHRQAFMDAVCKRIAELQRPPHGMDARLRHCAHGFINCSTCDDPTLRAYSRGYADGKADALNQSR